MDLMTCGKYGWGIPHSTLYAKERCNDQCTRGWWAVAEPEVWESIISSPSGLWATRGSSCFRGKMKCILGHKNAINRKLSCPCNRFMLRRVRNCQRYYYYYYYYYRMEEPQSQNTGRLELLGPHKIGTYANSYRKKEEKHRSYIHQR